MLEEKQIQRNIVFGTFGEPGYEEAWGRDDIKVDLFSSIVANGTHTIAMWLGENKYLCSYPMSGMGEYSSKKSLFLLSRGFVNPK